jgi:hypothetical protein
MRPPAAQDAGEAATIEIIQPEDIGEEQAVELALFQHTGDVLVPFGREHAEIGFRMTPGAMMVRGRPRQQEGHQVHLATRRHRFDHGPIMRVHAGQTRGEMR